MVKIPNDGQNQGLLPRVFEAYQVGSKPASWILGIAGGIFLGSVFFLVPDPTNAQCGILRFFMSLIGGLFFLFFVGGLVLEGKMKGFTVGAGGGAAVFFLLQFGVNPIPNCGKVNAVKGVEWSNGRELGQLIDILKNQRANGAPNIPKIEMGENDEGRIRRFNPHLSKVSARTWTELFEHICDSTNGCLLCDLSKGQQTVVLRTNGNWSKKKSNTGEYEYSCR